MVDLSQRLHGWTESVYKFACAFIHLSDFHGSYDEQPLTRLKATEKADILEHMRYYHGGPPNDDPSMQDLAMYIPMVFEKISGNLECCLKMLEKNEKLDY